MVVTASCLIEIENATVQTKIDSITAQFIVIQAVRQTIFYISCIYF